jgi:hypothetical protein
MTPIIIGVNFAFSRIVAPKNGIAPQLDVI